MRQDTRGELGVSRRRCMLDHYDKVIADAVYKRLCDGFLEREVSA
ncbi:MAG: hypothetical protein O7E57_08405 [Gammaproteobacteria bacterium]|nr:hypothetical protein [Gammaproteobacteria bacterium]